MSFVQGLKGYITEVALGKVEKNIDGREITRNLDKAIDEQLGERSSERIQRGPVWQFIKELAEGLYEEDINQLRLNLVEWARDLKPKE
mgnify:CR=1 FL=1